MLLLISAGKRSAKELGVLVLKDAKWFHLLPSGIFSGECPLYTLHSAFRFIVIILVWGTEKLINTGRVLAERGNMSSCQIIIPG